MKRQKPLSEEAVAEFAADIETRMKMFAGICLSEVISKIINETDVVILDSMGIDARQMLLRALIGEATTMLEETQDG